MIVFDNRIADMISNKKHHSLVTEIFIRGWKLNIYLVFIRQTYFPVPKHYIPHASSSRTLKLARASASNN